ncbi:DNA replication endonuclease-helicase Dna2, partial [Teratosphaeriaceae sp. CCFEE 6253]
MASRTKGFFEQDHSANQKQKPGQWHRGHNNNSNNSRPALGERDANAGVKPAIPATSQSKTKLKAFQFIPGRPERADEDVQMRAHESEREEASDAPKAERTSDVHAKVSSAPEKSNGPTTSSQTADGATTKDTPQMPHAHTFPCTPGARLALEDLIGNFDETARQQPAPAPSPEEVLGWIPHSSSALLTPNRKRRRAKSSSPSCPGTSSQRDGASTFFAAGNGTQGAQNRTPELDPTAALWQVYGAGKEGGSALKLPDLSRLAGLLDSPRAGNETPVKSAGFRRWASTGNEWPSTRHKRRRMESRTSVGAWREEQRVEEGGKSRVAEMVERIQETLATQQLARSTAKPPAPLEGPSSSSPLPATGAEGFGVANQSPLQARQNNLPPKPNPPPPVWTRPSSATRASPPAAIGRASPAAAPEDPMPERDAAPFVPTAPDVVKPTALHLQSKAPLPAFKRPAISRTASGAGRQYPVKPTPPPPPPPISNNEFD